MTIAPEHVDAPADSEDKQPAVPWQVVVWDDPVNLMTYVVWVFRKLFGYPDAKATRLMLDVHTKGRAVVTAGSREHAEISVYRLHHHGLWATMERA